MSWGWTRNRGHRFERVGVWGGGVQKANLLLQAYRACVLSSMGSPLVSCWPSASGGLEPFSVASLSERPRIRGNSMKSYSRAPMAPPIMGPTQYTLKTQRRRFQWVEKISNFKEEKDLLMWSSYPVVDKVPDQDSGGKGPCWVHPCTSIVHLGQRQEEQFRVEIL